MNQASGRLGRARFLRLGWYYLAPEAGSPFTHGSSAVVLVDDVNITTYLRTIELKQTTDAEETTGLLNRSKTYRTGTPKAELPFAGLFDPTHESTLKAIDRRRVTFAYSPAGTSTGNPTFSGVAYLTVNTPKSNTSEANNLEGNLSVVGTVTRTTN